MSAPGWFAQLGSKLAVAPAIAQTTVDLSGYDTLLTSRGQHG